MKYDVFMVGVGGQGILSIGEIIASAALTKGIPVNFYPSKGMAQRGGFVKASLRLGGETVGPNIAEKGADLVLSMEVSESLKAIRYVKPGGDFVLLGNIWAPTAVMLGKAGYPSVQDVIDQIKQAGANLVFINEADVPSYDGIKVADNIFMLGIIMKYTKLSQIISVEDIRKVIEERWPKAVEINRYALQCGLDYIPEQIPSVSEGTK